MLNKTTKLTALLVAAASVVSTMPVMAATRLASKDGTVEKGVAFKNGSYLFQGYKDDDDDNGIYYNDGSKDKLLDDADEIDRKFDKKYVSAMDGSDYYVVDMETGKITDDDTLEDLQSEAETKLANKLDDTDRYNSQKMDFKSGDSGDFRLNRVNDNKFEDVWYSYVVTSTSAASYDGKNGNMEQFGYTTQSGKYIDCSYDLNLYAYSTVTTDAAAKGKMYKIEDVEDTKDGVDDKYMSGEDKKISVAGVRFVKYIGQDDKYLYSIIAVNLKNSYSVYTGKKIDETTPHYYVQKVSKQQGDKVKDAYVPKDTECYEIAPEKDGQIAMGNGDVKDAYEALLADTDGVSTGLDNKNIRYAVVDGVIYAYFEDDTDKIKIYKISLKTSEKLNRYNSDLKKDKDASKLSGHVALKAGDKDHDMEDSNDNNCTWTVDVNGALWFIDGGKIYKSVKMGDFEQVYTCDRSIDSLDVYDENNLIAWDSDGDVYTNVSEGSAAAKEEAEELIGANENPAPQAKVGWDQLADGSWNLYDATGAKVLGWANVGGTWYYMDPSTGVMRTGWLLEGGNWYYLNPVSDGWKGAMKTGWLNDRGTWYYLQQSGVMKTGWLQDTDGRWYYLYSNGAMAANTTIDGYYVGSNGAWVR